MMPIPKRLTFFAVVIRDMIEVDRRGNGLGRLNPRKIENMVEPMAEYTDGDDNGRDANSELTRAALDDAGLSDEEDAFWEEGGDWVEDA